MTRALPLVILAGCWQTAPAGGETTPSLAPPTEQPRRCPQHRVTGTLRDEHLEDEPVVGATIVLSGRDLEIDYLSDVTSTDEQGRFAMRRRPGLDTMTVYYADGVFESRLPPVACRLVGHVASGLATGNGDKLPLVFDPPKPR